MCCRGSGVLVIMAAVGCPGTIAMNPRCLLILLALLSGSAFAEVYKWTDEAGRVHYGERPPPDGAQRMELPTDTVPAAGDADDARRRARQQRLLESFSYERDRKRQEQAREAEQARERTLACERIRRSWRRLSFPGPVYFKSDDGERRYLDDSERAAELDRLRPAYREACGEEP